MISRASTGRTSDASSVTTATVSPESDLVARTLLMHQHDGSNVASSKPRVGQITLQHDEVQFIDHGATILLGTKVTKRGTSARDGVGSPRGWLCSRVMPSQNQTRRRGARPGRWTARGNARCT